MSRKKTIGERLLEERKRLSLGPMDLAKAGGISRTTQYSYEKNESSPDADYLEKLIEIGVDAVYVFCGQRTTGVQDDSLSYIVQRFKTPNDAFLAVTELQKELNYFFPGDQLQSLIGFAWTAQASKTQLLEFIRGAYAIAKLDLPEQLLAADEQAAKGID